MKKSKFLALILAAIMVFGLLSGCGGDPAGQETPGADPNPPASGSAQPQTPSDGDFTIGFSSQHLTNDFNRGVLAGVTAKCEELGIELVTANAQGDSNKQVSDIENFLVMGVDAVIIGGGEGPAFAPIMQRMAEEGIPCITVDITSEYSTCNLTSDNFNGGEQLGLYVKNKLNGEGNILVLDTPGWQSLAIRIRMLEAVITDYPNIKIVNTISIGTQDAVNNYNREVKAYLQGNPDVQCIYCSWGLAAVGAAQALREMGLTDEIFVVCTDADQVVLEEMRKEDSPLTAVVGQYPDRLGSGAVEQAVNYLNGENVPSEAYAPIILIEKENPNAWFSSPTIMTMDEAWSTLYPDA